jgi:hypothetical protein
MQDSDKHNNPPTDLAWTRAFIWNNHGDTAVLFDAEGKEVSTVSGLVTSPRRPAGAAAEDISAAPVGESKPDCIVM